MIIFRTIGLVLKAHLHEHWGKISNGTCRGGGGGDGGGCVYSVAVAPAVCDCTTHTTNILSPTVELACVHALTHACLSLYTV